MLTRRSKPAQKVLHDAVSSGADMEEAPSESATDAEKANGDCDKELSQNEPCSTSEDGTEGKERRELKPPRILEVFLWIFLLFVYFTFEFSDVNAIAQSFSSVLLLLYLGIVSFWFKSIEICT